MFMLTLVLFATAHAAVDFEEMIRHSNARQASAQLLANAQNVLAHVERVGKRAAQLPSLTVSQITGHSGRMLSEADAECTTALKPFTDTVSGPLMETCIDLLSVSSTDQAGAKAYCEDVTVEGKTCVDYLEGMITMVFEKCINTGILETSCAAKNGTLCDSESECMIDTKSGKCVATHYRRKLASYVALPCVKDSDNKFCWPIFQKTAISFPENGTYDEFATQLEEICVECVYKMFNVYAKFQDTNDAKFEDHLDTICIKREMLWCTAMISTSSCDVESKQTCVSRSQCAWQDESLSCDNGNGQAFLENLCHPCFQAFLSRYVIIGKLDTEERANNIQTLSSIEPLCAKHPNGKYCTLEVRNYVTATPNFEKIIDCEGMTTLKANVGCCTGNALGLLKFGCDFDDVESQAEGGCAYDWEKLSQCGGDVAKKCPQQKFFIKAKLVVKGLKKEYYDNHRADIDMMLKKVIAYNTDSVTERIMQFKVVWTTMNTNRRLIEEDVMQVNFEVEAVSEAQVEAGLVSLKNPFLLGLSGLESSAYTDPEAGLNIVGEDSTSGAASLAPLGFAVLGGLACL